MSLRQAKKIVSFKAVTLKGEVSQNKTENSGRFNALQVKTTTTTTTTTCPAHKMLKMKRTE